MEDNNLPIPPKPPKPNNRRLFWIVVLTLLGGGTLSIVVLLGVATFLNGKTTSQVTFQRFEEEMLQQHDVEKVVAYRSGDLIIAEVYIKPDSLSKPQYHDAKKERRPFSSTGADDNGPQYAFTAATYDGLAKEINDSEVGQTDSQKIPVVIETAHESLFSNWFVQCIIMLVMPVGVWLFIKLVRGKGIAK